MTLVLYISFLLILPSIQGLIGYDCGAKELDITTISLREVGECEIPDNRINITQKYIQLLQATEYMETQVIQCKVEVFRTIYHCGMFSHNSIVLNGQINFIHETSRKACIEVHKTGILKVANEHVISGLRVNDTSSHPVLFAGKLNSDGKCNGAGYSDQYGSWENVIVTGSVTITLTEQTARVNLKENTIHFRSGTSCPLTDGECIDRDEGYTFWGSIGTDRCKFNQYSILYEGYADKMIDNNYEFSQVVYSVTSKDSTFALAEKGRESACGHVLIQTEHPKLLIFETTKDVSFAENKVIATSNLDIFAYVNSKFIYVEKHIKNQMKSLYRNILIQKCNLEKQTIRNSLSLATLAPDEFAHDLMKKPGFMAVVAGEVVHVIKCVPVEVKLEHGTTCYSELQVLRDNKTMFLTPRTHILKFQGTEVPCDRLLPSYYYVSDKWYKIMPLPTEALASSIIKPMTNSSWKYVSPANLAASGIYTEQELNQLRNRIMFPIEKPAVLNDLAREIRGYRVTNHGSSILNLLNEDAMEKIIDNTWTKIWSRFLTFGTVSAGVIAILTIFHIIKLIVGVFLRGYAIHSVYGWSIHLLGALFSSISHFLLHLAQGNQVQRKQNTTDIELGETKPMIPTQENRTSASQTKTQEEDEQHKISQGNQNVADSDRKDEKTHTSHSETDRAKTELYPTRELSKQNNNFFNLP